MNRIRFFTWFCMMNKYLRFSFSGSNIFCQFSSFNFLKWSASRFSRETRIEIYQISPYFLLFINYVDSPFEVFTISHSKWYPAFKPLSENKGLALLFCLNFFIFISRFSIKVIFRIIASTVQENNKTILRIKDTIR